MSVSLKNNRKDVKNKIKKLMITKNNTKTLSTPNTQHQSIDQTYALLA